VGTIGGLKGLVDGARLVACTALNASRHALMDRLGLGLVLVFEFGLLNLNTILILTLNLTSALTLSLTLGLIWTGV
jgi:hypothetical protein